MKWHANLVALLRKLVQRQSAVKFMTNNAEMSMKLYCYNRAAQKHDKRNLTVTGPSPVI